MPACSQDTCPYLYSGHHSFWRVGEVRSMGKKKATKKKASTTTKKK